MNKILYHAFGIISILLVLFFVVVAPLMLEYDKLHKKSIVDCTTQLCNETCSKLDANNQ